MFGFAPPPTGPARKWDVVRKGGPIHLLEYRRISGTWRWEAVCGLWARGYKKIDSRDHGRGTLQCLACLEWNG